MLTLETAKSKASILLKGAELCSLFCKETHTEYIWDAHPDFWNKHSPILFPIVGTLKNNTFSYKDKAYSLPRHGFARDMNFEIEHQEADQATLYLNANEETLKDYPFLFCLKVHYKLSDHELQVRYTVENKGNEVMYFSIGGHPAFKIPINNSLSFEDYILEFEHKEQSDVYPLNQDGYLSIQGVPFLNNTQILPLKKDLFYEDALIFKQLLSKSIRLSSAKDNRYVHVAFDNFPYLGIWSKKGADFVCIEPWNGITDTENTNGQLQDKEGISALPPQEIWSGKWSVQFG